MEYCIELALNNVMSGCEGGGTPCTYYYVATWKFRDFPIKPVLAYSATQVVTFLVWATLMDSLSCLGSPKTLGKTGESRKEGWWGEHQVQWQSMEVGRVRKEKTVFSPASHAPLPDSYDWCMTFWGNCKCIPPENNPFMVDYACSWRFLNKPLCF